MCIRLLLLEYINHNKPIKACMRLTCVLYCFNPYTSNFNYIFCSIYYKTVYLKNNYVI